METFLGRIANPYHTTGCYKTSIVFIDNGLL